MHRNIHGQKADHALLACEWKWRLRSVKSQPAKDFSSLQKAETCGHFNDAIEEKLVQLAYNAKTDDATAIYDKMCMAIQHAVEKTLPTVTKERRVQRAVSAHTQALFKSRTKMTGTKAEYEAMQKKIKQNSLQGILYV